MLGAALLMGTPLAAGAVPNRAVLSGDERAAGLWYADRMKFDQIREQGLTGKGMTIAVIDSAINLEAPELQGADIEVRGQFCKNKETGEEPPAVSTDLARSHGTDVVSMLVGNGVAGDGGVGTRGIVPEAKILFYAVGLPMEAQAKDGSTACEAYNPVTGTFESDDPRESSDTAEWPILDPDALAARQAVEDGVDVISISRAASVFTSGWELAQIHAMRAGVPIVASTPNPTGEETYELKLPFGMNGVVAVGGVDVEGNVIRGLNMFGEVADAEGSSNLAVSGPAFELLSPSGSEGWGPSLASGTSIATPLIAGTIALGLEKYPEATAFQVLQSLIRNTGKVVDAEPVWSGREYGYGIVNPVSMLAVDPTQYPDENPLFVVSLDDPRCGVNPADYDDCDWALMLPTAKDVWPKESGGGNSGAEAENPFGSGILMATMVAGAVVLLAAGVTVPLIVARSKKKRKNLGEPSATSVGR
ncbi:MULTISPECIES: S8 family serine peptidase [unclassified Leucobacter]|uniref:S8 family serine peptidase n=1 Tax=unclassified Leucobacter TaxID=2621730 RepID=UPI00165D5460|nr:S8 family serine peptidase [Leucobacter sp. CX169]MBC9927487.1 S8 family serine peptidase [Leucobacter sp. cx-169]